MATAIFYDGFLNRIAPNLAAVTACNAPKLTVEASLTKSFLTLQTFMIQLRPQWGSLALYFMRHIDEAIETYNRMIDITTEWLPKKNVAPAGYYRAVTEAEHCIGAVAQALRMLDTMGKKKAFVKDDGSPEQRAWDLHRFIKHVDERVLEQGKAPPNGTIACWITNDGLKCADHEVSFKEMAELIAGLHGAGVMMLDKLIEKARELKKAKKAQAESAQCRLEKAR